MTIKRADCPHGVEYGRGDYFGGASWNGAVRRCECCLSSYGEIGSGTFTSTTAPLFGQKITVKAAEPLCPGCVQS